ncbi:hypothetical protein [Sulfurisphaera javensis]
MKDKKVIISHYVITTDVNDLSPLINFLEKYKIRAYNYKVKYVNGKVFVRAILSDNVILSIENLTLDEAEKLIPPEIQPSKYYIEFHNVRPENISFFNSLSFYSAEFHVFPSYIFCKIDEYRCKVKEEEILTKLSEIFSTIKNITKPFNMNFLNNKEKLICEIILKYNGIRNPEEIENCEIIDDKVIYKGNIIAQINLPP